MKTKLIRTKSPSRRVKVVFLGWSADDSMERLFVSEDYDVLLVWDYRDWTFDYSILNDYEEIKLFAWSLGVFASGEVMSRCSQRIVRSVAFAGTLLPIDNAKGIPQKVYELTTNTLSPAALKKFRLRMCGGAEGLKTFPLDDRECDIEELKAALVSIEKRYMANGAGSFTFDKAYICGRDKIFPPDNQLSAWQTTTESETIDCEHFDFEQMRNIFAEL